MAKALRELGRIERSLFMLEWYSSPALRRRCQAGLNKGEAAHKLKRAVFFHERGEIRLARGKGAKDSPRTDALRDLDMLVGAMVLPCGADENLATEILQACAIPPAPTA